MPVNPLNDAQIANQSAPEVLTEAYELRQHPQASEGKQIIIPDGLHLDPHEEKQVNIDDQEAKEPYVLASQPSTEPFIQNSTDSSKPKKRTRLCIIIGIVAFLIIVAVCVPTAVIVSRNNSHRKSNQSSTANASSSSTPSDLPVNATINPSPVSSTGSGSVLKGTRLSTMDPRTGGDVYLFYQWTDNGIRYISQSPEKIWQGSTNLNVPDAKAGSPIATVSTAANGSITWWLFYVDNDNIIQNVQSLSDPTTWRKGNIGDKRYAVPNETSIAFTTTRGLKYNRTIDDLDGGLSLYAAASNGTIQEYIFNDQDENWNNGFTFTNTNGFFGASTWSVGSSAILTAASNSGAPELWTKIYSNTTNTVDKQWQLGPSSHAEILQNGSMCAQFDLAFQSSSGIIQGSTFSTANPVTDTRWNSTYDISNQSAITGSAVSCWYFYSSKKSNPNIKFQVFYQTDGSKIEEAITTWGSDNATVGGTWSYNSLPI